MKGLDTEIKSGKPRRGGSPAATVRANGKRRGPGTLDVLIRHGALTFDEGRAARHLSRLLGESPTLLRARMFGAPAGGTSDDCRATDAAVVGRIDGGRYLKSWLQRLEDEGVDSRVAIAVLAHGSSLSSVDRQFVRRKGWARAQLLAAIRLAPKSGDSQ